MSLDKYTPEQLARAKRRRDRELANLQEEYAVCVCCYPVVSYRNVHGHNSECPAYALLQERAKQALALREEHDL